MRLSQALGAVPPRATAVRSGVHAVVKCRRESAEVAADATGAEVPSCLNDGACARAMRASMISSPDHDYKRDHGMTSSCWAERDGRACRPPPPSPGRDRRLGERGLD